MIPRFSPIVTAWVRSWSAGLARWRCREQSRQLYVGTRVLRVLSLGAFIRFSSETLTLPYFACKLK